MYEVHTQFSRLVFNPFTLSAEYRRPHVIPLQNTWKSSAVIRPILFKGLDVPTGNVPAHPISARTQRYPHLACFASPCLVRVASCFLVQSLSRLNWSSYPLAAPRVPITPYNCLSTAPVFVTVKSNLRDKQGSARRNWPRTPYPSNQLLLRPYLARQDTATCCWTVPPSISHRPWATGQLSVPPTPHGPCQLASHTPGPSQLVKMATCLAA